MNFRIELDGHHNEDSAVVFRTICDRFVVALRDTGYTVTGSVCAWDDELAEIEVTEIVATDDVVVEAGGEPPTLAGIDFASDNSAELAATLNLNASHFDGMTPSGKGGYTSRDVRKAARA